MKSWKISAGKVPPATGLPRVLVLHRLELVRVADPDRDRHVVVAAHEPGVAVVLGGAGLAPDVLVADLRGLAGAAADDQARACPSPPAPTFGGSTCFSTLACSRSTLPSPSSTLWIATGPVSSGASEPEIRFAVVGDRGVGVGHLERRDALLQAAEQHRRVGGELGPDAHALGERARPAAASPSCRARRTPSCPSARWPTRATRTRSRSRRSCDTSNVPFWPCPFTNGSVFGCEAQTLFGSTPSSSARARMNGLKAEPGWRWPLVARLKGRALKSEPPTIARTSPVLVLDRHERGVRARRRPAGRRSPARPRAWSSGSSVVWTFRPPPNTLPAR